MVFVFPRDRWVFEDIPHFTGAWTGEDELDAGGGDSFGLSGVEGY